MYAKNIFSVIQACQQIQRFVFFSEQELQFLIEL